MRVQEKLYNQIKDLKERKGGDILVNNLRQKIKDGVIYNELSEEDVEKAFNAALENTDLNAQEVKKVEEKKEEVLKEAVTFVDNAGNVKTTTAEEYNKQMHEYDTDTQIKDFKKKDLEKREYNLLDECFENIFSILDTE